MKLIKPQQWSVFGILVIACLLVTLFTIPALSQSRTHNLGDFSYQLNASDYISTSGDDAGAHWPQDHFRYWQIHFYHPCFMVGSWIDEDGAVHSKERFAWINSFDNAEGYGISEYKKYEPPEVYVFSEGTLQRSSRRFNGTVDPNIPSDQMITLHYKAEPGFDVTLKSYSFSNENHNDYIIIRMRYLCTFDWDEDPEPDTDDTQTLEDVYFAYGYTFQNGEGTYLTYSRWWEEAEDDWASYESRPSDLTSTGRDLHVAYGWDGDHPGLLEFEPGGQEFDDTGDPRFGTGEGASSLLPSGELISAEYGGFAALHVDTSPTDRTDDFAQPTSVSTNTNIYHFWDEDYPGYATAWDWAASGTKTTVEDQAGWPDDASGVTAEYPYQAFGPYDFTLGDSIVIVYALAINGLDRKLAIEKGLEWRAWYRGEAGAEFDDDAKNTLLATAKESLFVSLDRALWAWNRDLIIPAPLPAPDLTVKSGPNVVYLEWEDMSEVGDPITGVPDLDHYNIYRKLGNFLVDTYDELNSEGTHRLWEKIAEVPASTTEYTDEAVTRGQSYHYAVTAVDDGTQNTDGIFPGQKLESSIYANRSQIDAIPFLPGAETTDNVRIVPNPYIIGAEDFNFAGDSNRLLFANLPPYCTLRIYTATGDLIKTIDHVSGSADELWDQVTESTQYIASGVYILQISDARDLNQKPLPDSIEKFVVIR